MLLQNYVKIRCDKLFIINKCVSSFVWSSNNYLGNY